MAHSSFIVRVALPGLVLVLLGCASAGPQAADAPTVESGAIEGREVVLTIFGMSCPLCANNVDKVLLDVPGVEAVTVDMGSGSAVVTLDGRTPVTQSQLVHAVERSGFTLQRIDATR